MQTSAIQPVDTPNTIGEQIHQHATELFPICRSLSGQGVRDTLAYLQNYLPAMEIISVDSGTKVFDWEVPEEWNIRDAWIKNANGDKIVDFKVHNLHVMGYSEPVNTTLSLEELRKHLYSLPDQPNAIPYITSYYKRRWGFCMTHEQLQSLEEGEHHVYIDSTLEPGKLHYGELIIKGQSTDEILLSTYICHPSMGNNELSGPCVTLELARWLQSLNGNHRYTYRILFLVETIGSIMYLSKHLEHMQRHVKAGYVLSCVGDDLDYSIVHTPDENTLAEKALEHVLIYHTDNNYSKYPFTKRGSDERQYCSAGAELPVAGFCRSKYAEFPEYHTSLDDLNFITPTGLGNAFDVMQKTIELLERNQTYRTKMPCEPQLGKRGLYPTVSTKDTVRQTRDMMNFIAYSNGKRSVLDIAEKTNTDATKFFETIDKLLEADVVEKV